MKKPANLILQFPATSFWLPLVQDTHDSQFREFTDFVIARLPVKSFSLEDGQFIQIHTKRKSGGESVSWIPREIVKGIVEGKSDNAAFYFGGGKK